MQWLAALCVRRPVFASVLILSLTVIGAFAFLQLGVDRYPKVDFPTVAVTTVQPGAAPEQIETEITDKIEEAVNTISGIDTLTSTSSEGISQVVVAFVLDKDGDVAAQEVRDKVNGVLPLLPKTIQQPRVTKFDPDAAPVLTLALSANKPVRDITEYADKVLRRQIESLGGVGQVLVVGGRQRQVNVWLDADRLRAYNVTVTDVSRALQSQNIEIPGGRMDQGPQSVTLRTQGRVQTVTEFNDIVVRQNQGHPIKISDVAQVEDGQADANTLANIDGAPTVLLQVRRQSGTNTVEVVENIRERLEGLKQALPAGYNLQVVRDTSDFIQASIHNVEEHLVVGSILAALVVLLFLTNLRSTIIAAIAIPTSIVATFGLVWYMGFTLNSLTMLALTLSVGIVIDDAIVVLENIYRFIEEKHEDQFTAAIEGTREIGLAVLATTLSLVAIFVPVGFMGGIVGRFMKSFGLTMAFAIMVSLLVSFTLTPMLSARWLKVDRNRRASSQGLEGLSRGRCVLHALARLVDGPSVGRRWHRGAGARVKRAAVLDRGQELPAKRRPVGVRNQPARARGHESRVDRGADEPHRDGGEIARAGSGVHRRLGRRRSGADAQRGQHLRAAQADRRPQAGPVRRDGRHPEPDPAERIRKAFARRCRRSPTSAAAARRTPTSSSSSTARISPNSTRPAVSWSSASRRSRAWWTSTPR